MLKPNEVYTAEMPDNGTRTIRGPRPVAVLAVRGAMVTVVPMTTTVQKKKYAHHVSAGPEHGLARPSTLLTEQLTCIDKALIRRFVTRLPDEKMREVKAAISAGLNLPPAA